MLFTCVFLQRQKSSSFIAGQIQAHDEGASSHDAAFNVSVKLEVEEEEEDLKRKEAEAVVSRVMVIGNEAS